MSTFFVYISEKGKGNLERRVFLSIAFLLVFIPSAIRYNIGTDFLSYIYIYESLDLYKEKIEPGYYFLNLFLKIFNANPQWVIASSAFIFTSVTFLAYPKKHAWILHFCFFSMLWYFSFNGIRQALATAFCFYAIFQYLEKKYISFIVITLVGSLFHFSAIFTALVGLLALIPVNKTLKTHFIPIIFITLIGITFISMTIVMVYLEKILSFLGFTKYAAYFGSRHFIQRDFGSGAGVIAKLLFSIYVILNTKYLLRINKQFWFVIVLVFLYSVSLVLANSIIIFGRMAVTFISAPVLSAYALYSINTNRKAHLTVLSFFFLLLIMTYTKDGIGTVTSYADPKLNPFQTIFK